MSIFCPNCGAPLEDNAAFCGACGHTVQPPQAEPVSRMQPPPAPAQSYPQQPPYPPAQSYPQQPPYPPAQPTDRPYSEYMPQTPVSPPQSYPPQTPPSPPQGYQPQTPAYGAPGYETYRAPAAKKSRKGLIIALSASAAVLIAAAIIIFVVIKPFGGSSATPQELMDNEDRYYYNTDDPDIDAYLDQYFEYHFICTQSEKEDWRNNMIEDHKADREYYKSEYGEDAHMTTVIADYVTLSGAELESAQWDYTPSSSSSSDEPIAVDEIRRAHIEYTLSGSLKTETRHATVDFVKKDGRWYIGYWNQYDDSVN